MYYDVWSTKHNSNIISTLISIYPSGFITAVAVFRKPNATPPCLSTDPVPNLLLSWPLAPPPSTFFLDVLFSFSPPVSTPKLILGFYLLASFLSGHSIAVFSFLLCLCCPASLSPPLFPLY